MVRSTKKLTRAGFTLIELIFAIVVIAISVMSLPMVSRVTSQGMENNLLQEAIFTAIAEINLATTYTWDNVSLMDSTDDTDSSKVVNTGDCAVINNKMPGHISRDCYSDLTARPTQEDNGTSLESAEHGYKPTFEDGSGDYGEAKSSASAYKSAYEGELIVNLDGKSKEFGEVDNSNIKEIEVSIKNEDGTTATILRAYSCNIGETKPETEGL